MIQKILLCIIRSEVRNKKHSEKEEISENDVDYFARFIKAVNVAYVGDGIYYLVYKIIYEHGCRGGEYSSAFGKTSASDSMASADFRIRSVAELPFSFL